MTSKPKFGIKGLGAVTARTTQKMREKVGRSEETVDVGFNQECQKFEVYYKQLKKLAKDLSEYVKTLRAISDGHQHMGASTSVFYDSGSPLYEVNQRYIATVMDIDRARQAMDETLRLDIVAPVDHYLGQYKTIENRINERSRRRLEMDRFRDKVRKYQIRPPEKREKMESAQANFNMWKAAYEEINQELIRDIAALCADRHNFFDPCYSTLIQATARYYQEVSTITSSLVPMVQHVDGQLAHNPRCVITDDESTVALKTYQELKKPGMSTHTPSYQQPPSYASTGAYGQPAPTSSGFGAPAGYQQSPPTQHYGGPPSNGGGYSQPAPQQQGYGLAPPPHGSPQQQQQQFTQQQFQKQRAMSTPAQRGAPPPMPGRPMPARPAGEQARALYAFAPEAPTELGFQPGQMLTILGKNGEWWEAEVNGRRGLIPANYVQLV